MTATPSPNYSDQQILATDPTFQNRVRQSAILFIANVIGTESPVTVAFHRERQTYAAQIMANPDTYKVTLSQLVATNATVMADATVNGTVPLTSGNVATQAALVTDPHIDNAIAADYNNLFRVPAS
jgi:hypothetical protein